MVQYLSLTASGIPEAHITSGKSRLKVEDGIVYLNNDQEFEIELYNPSTYVYGVEILLNGQPTSNSYLILKPGQRIYLERYLNESKKFKFDVYEVDEGEDAAIAKNGKVEIRFYQEFTNYAINSYNYVSYDNTDIFGGTWSGSVTYSDVSLTTSAFKPQPIKHISEKETGRVAKGEKSKQELVEVNGYSFFSFPSNTYYFHLKPASQAPPDTAKYCTSCGYRKRKDSWKFCPKCGTKY